MTNEEIVESFPEADFINEIYELRLGYQPDFIMPGQMNTGATVRALVELRLYHLPTYYKVHSLTKSKLCSQSGPCFQLGQDIIRATLVERETFFPDSTIFLGKTREHCSICGSTRATKNGVCYHCTAIETGLNAVEERKLCKEYNSRLARENSSPKHGNNWTSPKKLFLAEELGCLRCGKKQPFLGDELWTGPETEFNDGLCKDCSHSVQGPYWNTPPEPYSRPTYPISDCLVCHQNHTDYALWGMCHECYYKWQESWLNKPLPKGARKLLISPSKEWRAYALQDQKFKLKRPMERPDVKGLVRQFYIKKRSIKK